ncbi:MAG TPA: cytochrome c oxidase assembly factor Coa1 family protein [Pyrinomonadaceae bacterium]|nr:cytochrome c oxidase assembly factor Coa1 family protein [Pyrinomonadaceae bacterium]
MTTKKAVLIVAGVVGVLGLVVVLFVVGIVGFALYQVGNSEAARKSKDFLRTNEKLKQDIGDVKDFGSIVTGSISFSGGSGRATINLKVIGEQKTVNASVDLVLVSGSSWRVSAASYVNDTGQTIDLLDPYDTKLLIPLLIA